MRICQVGKYSVVDFLSSINHELIHAPLPSICSYLHQQGPMDKASPSPLLRKEDRDIECANGGLKSGRNGSYLREWNQFSGIASIAIPWILLAIVLSSNTYYTLYGTDRFHQHKFYSSQLTYSPAQDEIEYEVKMYHTGIEHAPVEFQGPPSESLDRAWDSIFNCKYK